MPNTKKSHSLVINLIKENVSESEIINETGTDMKNLPGIGKIYYLQSPTIPAKWGKLFEGHNLNLMSSSASGVLITSARGRAFAITFGPKGRYIMRKGIIEERFGLLVTLNSVRKDSLRSMDIATLETDGLQTRIQSARPNFPENFGFDIERDLIRCVTGESTDINKYGKVLTGKDSLKVRLKCELSDLRGFLEWFFDQFVNLDYKTNFPWIDKLAEENNSDKILLLTNKLLEEINKSETEKLWLTVPEIIDWSDHGGFSYDSGSDPELFDDISLEEFKNKIGSVINLDHLNNRRIYHFSSDGTTEINRWKVFNCIYFEYNNPDDNETYFLSAGKWYKVSNDLVSEVKDNYNSIPFLGGLNVPNYEESHEDENAYNNAFASQNSALCLDRRVINITGRSTFEFCDVYTRDKKMIHVKRYSGSSVLSHLFNQGYVSATLFLDKKIRERINDELLSSGYKITDTTRRPNEGTTGEYSIVFGIIKRGAGSELEIPFFSKLTLMHVSKDLKNLGYGVYLLKIQDEKPQKKEVESNGEES